MRGLGYLLITAGFLAGSLAAVQTKDNEVELPVFVVAVIVGIVGVVLAHVGTRRETHQVDRLETNVETLRGSIERIVANITALDDQKESLDPYDVHDRIDTLFPDDVAAFVDARESIAHVFGLKAYADIMNDFAAAERYLNRVWSASIDGYIDEVHEHLGKARDQFGLARDKLQRLGPGSTP